jgi:hypothetical protein
VWGKDPPSLRYGAASQTNRMSKIGGRNGWPAAKSKVPRRRKISTRNWKIVILRKNKNSKGAKILFFGESRFRMISDISKNRATGASTAL